jgi:predicted ATP-grasp superfamily ATP-dependent carboligase/pyruvate/2-oxoglutarate dehydrogenase complex dihydrolipoamide dehydrogenase (E3) component
LSNPICEVAILGAGPYGLSVASHLRRAGVETLIFGRPMEFWRGQMPRGMLLRSSRRASSIGAPIAGKRLEDYGTTAGIDVGERVRLEDFANYGDWFQRNEVSDVDHRNITQLRTSSNGFTLVLEDGEQVEARRVVVAAGIGPFAHRPPQFDGLPKELVFHSADHAEFSKFAGAKVIVLGAGQSSFESAALLAESGATVEILVRAPEIRWLKSAGFHGEWHAIHAILYPETEVGPLGFNHVIAHPRLFRQLPYNLQKYLTYTAVRPMVSDWLAPRVAGSRIDTGRTVSSAIKAAKGLQLTLDDGTTRDADHVMLATGYRIDISRYGFIAPDLLKSIERFGGFPVLSISFESSVPGLYFVGAPATHSFGPLVRFVAGTKYSGRAVAKSILANRGRPSAAPLANGSSGANGSGGGNGSGSNGPANHRPSRSSETVGALVVGGDYGALGIVRSLGRHNVPVWTLVDKHRLAGLSRYSNRTLPWPKGDEEQQLEFLIDLKRKYGLDGWVLFPVGDEHAALFARNRDLLSRSFRVTTPCWEVLRWAYDKRLTYRLAASLGLNYPFTFYPRNRDEVGALECRFPVILKPAFKRNLNRFTRAKAWLAHNRDDLIRRYDEAASLIDPNLIMIQEMINGGGENQFSYAGLYFDGRPAASLVARRTRQFPADFGRASSYVETVEQNEIEAAAKLLLEAMRYTGVVEVEFKHDPDDKCFKLLDVNARIWAWHTLGGRAGVDFPYLLWQYMQNKSESEVRARPGQKWIHMLLDVPAGVNEVWSGRLSPGAYLKSVAQASEYAVLAKDDPLPAVAEIPLMMAAMWRPLLTKNGTHS